jgi:hypothetical protein
MKFDLMCPALIYRSYISRDDSIFTELFPGRDAPVLPPVTNLTAYSRSRNLTVPKLADFASRLGYHDARAAPASVPAFLNRLQAHIERDARAPSEVLPALATALYWPDISSKIAALPDQLQSDLRSANLV